MLKNIIPPPLYMLLFAGAMYLLAQYLPVLTLLEAPANKIAYVFAGLALLLDFSALIQFFQKRTTPNPIKPQNASKLVTKGLYRFSRNPMYLGLFFWLVAWGLYLGKLSPFFLLPLFVAVITLQQILPEEKVLEEKFGSAYKEYKQRVRRWL